MNAKNPMGLRLTEEAINMNLDARGLEQALQMEDRNQILLAARALLNQGEKKGKDFQKKNTGDRIQKAVAKKRGLSLDPRIKSADYFPMGRISPMSMMMNREASRWRSAIFLLSSRIE